MYLFHIKHFHIYLMYDNTKSEDNITVFLIKLSTHKKQ